MNPDIYILDIEMEEINGLQVAAEIRKRSSEAYILFVTSHTQYAIDAFDVHAFKYILKSQIADKLEIALEEIEEKLSIEKRLYYIVNTKERHEKIYYKDIYYIYKERKNSVVVKKEDRICTRHSIRQIYDELNAEQFIYIDRGCVVNIIHVMKIYGNEIYMRNGERLPISRRNINEVKRRVHAYWRDRI